MSEPESYTTEQRKEIFSEGMAAFDAWQQDPINGDRFMQNPYTDFLQPVAYALWENGWMTAKGQAEGAAPTWLDFRD